ncbi:Patellin [Heracleum sosnowskyi]|uniref:Patellin n=1 Tax=Heracleum sosnowskyi TaxID=360622 RepID=A0AAD8M1Y1_9APIA|nr:Patellin [Heracleum sosnowskyi]
MTVEVIKAEVATVSHQEEKMKVVEEAVEVKKDVEEAKPESVDKTSSFKEESNFVSDLKDHEKKALTDFKAKLEQAILGNSLFKKEEVKVEQVVEEKKEQVVEEVKEKEVEDKEKVEGEEASKKSGEKKGWKSTIQEAFKGHGLFKKDEVKVEEDVVEEKAKVEEEKKEECVEEQVVKVEESVEVKEGEKVEEKDKLVEVGEESSKKSGEKKGLNKLKSKIGEAFKGGLFKKDEPKVEEVVEEKVKVEEEKKEEEVKEVCAEEVVQEDVKEKESETVVEMEKVEEGEESSKKGVEKTGLNKFKSTIQGAFKGHLFGKKSKKEVEEKKEELKPEGDDKVEEEAKPEGDDKVEAESKPECEDKVEEKKEEEVVEVIKTEVSEEKEAEAVVEEVAEEIKTEECEEEKKVEEVVEEETKVEEVDKDISLWGVPLLASKADEGTDVVLLKFLRARDFKVNEAFEMLKKTLEWRKEWKLDSILDEDLETDLSSAAYMSGVDREGHPICYNIFGVLDDEELYQKTLGSEEKRNSFLRWRFQLMERGIHKLELKPSGVTSLLQINDLKNSPGPAKKEVRLAIKQALGLLQDNYPEFVARNIFINVPFWYYAYKAVFSTLLTQRSKSKLVFARPAKVTETLLKFIPVEEIPIQYGGLKRDSDFEFSSEDCTASELIIKATSTATIEIPAPEAGTTFIWDITVLGWDVNYKEEFVPTDECSYTIIVQKQKKLSSIEGPIRNTFRTNEPGKIVLTIENCSNKKKKVFYRNKVKKSAF